MASDKDDSDIVVAPQMIQSSLQSHKSAPGIQNELFGDSEDTYVSAEAYIDKMTEKHVTPLSHSRRKLPSVGTGSRAPQRRLAFR